MLTWNQEPLLALLEEAKREYIAAQVNRISIYYADTSNNWRTACTRPKRPLTSIVLDPGVKDVRFISSQHEDKLSWPTVDP
jgi:chaperone BCS1